MTQVVKEQSISKHLSIYDPQHNRKIIFNTFQHIKIHKSPPCDELLGPFVFTYTPISLKGYYQING
jgi:hypothetical protein